MNLRIAFVAIARPTFDVPFAQEKTAQVLTGLRAAELELIGDEALVMDASAINSAIVSLKESDADILLVLQASFADSTMVRQLAEAIQVPVLLWALPEERTGGRLRLNSFCGINLAGHSLKRAGIDYDYLYAHPDDEAAIEKVVAYSKAAKVAKKLKTTKIGRVGENPAGFETCLYDAENLKTRLGVEVKQLDLHALFDTARHADTLKVQGLEAKMRETLAGYETVNQEEARGTLSSFVALDETAKRENLQGMAVRCWPEFFTDFGCSACGAMSMLNDKFIPASCEADVNGTITSLILQEISGNVAFGTDMVDFDVEDNTAVLWHCGLAPLAMADPDAVAEAALHSNRKKPLLMQFPLKAGRVTVARLSESTGELRLVIGLGEMLKRPMSFTGTSGVIRFDSGTKNVMDSILSEGLEHHVSITYGEHIEALKALAKILKLPILEL